MSNATDYSAMSKDELADHLGKAFGDARPFVERNEPIPTDIWSQINGTVAGLCNRVGIDTPKQLVEIGTES